MRIRSGQADDEPVPQEISKNFRKSPGHGRRGLADGQQIDAPAPTVSMASPSTMSRLPSRLIFSRTNLSGLTARSAAS